MHLPFGLATLRRSLVSGSATARLARGASVTGLIKLASAVLFLASQILFARLLGVDGFGVYVLAYAWLNVLLLAARQGYDVATVRFVAIYKADGEWGLLRGFLRSSGAGVAAASIAVAAALAIGAYVLRDGVSRELLHALWLAAATLPMFALMQICEAAHRGLGQIARSQLMSSLGLPILMIVLLPLAIQGLGRPADGATGMAVCLAALTLCLAGQFLMLRRVLPDEMQDAAPRYRRREWIGAALAMTFLMSFVSLMSQANIIILGAMAEPADAGLYAASMRFANVVPILVTTLNAALAPIAAELHARRGLAELQRVVTAGVRATFAAALVAALAIAALGPWLLALLGEGFAQAYPLLLVLLAGQLAHAATAPAAILLNMTGHHAASARLLALCALLNITASVALIPLLGTLGAAVAMSVTAAAMGALMAVTAFRKLGLVAVAVPWSPRPGRSG